jgi:hypothetical protein
MSKISQGNSKIVPKSSSLRSSCASGSGSESEQSTTGKLKAKALSPDGKKRVFASQPVLTHKIMKTKVVLTVPKQRKRFDKLKTFDCSS